MRGVDRAPHRGWSERGCLSHRFWCRCCSEKSALPRRTARTLSATGRWANAVRLNKRTSKNTAMSTLAERISALSPERRELFEAQLKKRGLDALQRVPIARRKELNF